MKGKGKPNKEGEKEEERALRLPLSSLVNDRHFLAAVGELKLAQHALIKSTEHQPTAVNWTHLGGFYLVHEEPRLAHEAFSVAQALDPSFVTCWVGQVK